MRKLILSAIVMAFFAVIFQAGYAQGCTMTVSYDVATSAPKVAAFQADSASFGNALASQYNTSFGLVTTASVFNVVPVGVGEVTFDVTFTLPSPADTTTILQAYSDFGFIVGVDAQVPASLSSFISGLIVVSSTNTCLAPPAPVPTLSQWGLIFLSLILANIGAVAIWRRQQNGSERELEAVG